MPCPMCASENMAVYDRDHYECKDCGRITRNSEYQYRDHTIKVGKCKIISIRYTKEAYGLNDSMVKMVNDNTVYKYETKKCINNIGKESLSYRINGWAWSIGDLMIVDDDGNEIDEFPIPEPTKFNTNFLDV